MMKSYAVRIQDREGFERRIPLGSLTVFGRQKQCDVVLSDEMVSRLHLRVECIDGVCWVEDLGSSHGTFKDGERIKRIQWEQGTVLVMADEAYKLMIVPERLQATELSMSAILSIAQQMAGEFDLEQIMKKTLEHLLRLSGQDRGFIMMPDTSDEDKLKIFVQQNPTPRFEVASPQSMSSAQHVFDTGEPIWVSGVSVNEALKSKQSAINMQLQTVFCLPLSAKGKRIGVVYLDSMCVKPVPIDRYAFEAIVGLCAVAIDKALMYDEIRRNRLLASVSSVAIDIVHDFKNALSIIDGHVEMLRGLCDDPEVISHVEQIQTSVDRLVSRSSEILGYAQMKPIERKPVDLAALFYKIIADWQSRTAELYIDITGSGPECTANLDEAKITSVIDELFINASDALVGTENKGHIQLLWTNAPEGVVIKVEDNGPGISNAIINNVFNPFFSQGKENRAGLGLSKIKKYIELHGGTIDVVSQQDSGTSFTIFLPINDLEPVFKPSEQNNGGKPVVSIGH